MRDDVFMSMPTVVARNANLVLPNACSVLDRGVSRLNKINGIASIFMYATPSFT